MFEKVLVVDDSSDECALLETMLRGWGYAAEAVTSGLDAVEYLKHDTRNSVGLVIVDLIMPDMDGMALLLALRKQHAEISIIVMAREGDQEAAEHAVTAGAFDFVSKPVDAARLKVSVRNAFLISSLKSTVPAARRYDALSYDFASNRFLDSNSIVPLIERMKNALSSGLPICLEGDADTGVDEIACAVLSDFHGQDECVQELDLSKLTDLCALDVVSPTYLRNVELLNGSEQTELRATLEKLLQSNSKQKARPPVIVSCIGSAAMHCETGRINSDLFNLLNINRYRVPRLVERQEDIIAIAQDILRQLAMQNGSLEVCQFTEVACVALQNYRWPGNYRELERVVASAFYATESSQVDLHHFTRSDLPSQSREQDGENTENSALYGLLPVFCNEGHARSLQALEDDQISYALQRYNGQLSEVARRLGIGRSTLYRKLTTMHDASVSTEQSTALNKS